MFTLPSHEQRSERQRLGLQQRGFKDIVHVARCLQGNIWRATLQKTPTSRPQKVVIKMASTTLHNQRWAHVKDQVYMVEEDLVKEGKLLELVTCSTDCPDSIVKYVDSVNNINPLIRKPDLYLAMEDGGNSLFEFIVKCHVMIKDGIIDYSHWMEVVHLIFKQMLESVEYIHSKNVCHFDISLENFLINDVPMIVTEQDHRGIAKKAYFALNEIQVKLCDFGLAEKVPLGHLSKKFCGKTNYKSPEVTDTEQFVQFDPRKNDIWCLGICLFTAAFGSNPWDKASPKDTRYQVIVNEGRMKDVLKHWGLKASNDLIDLLKAFFKPEDERIFIQDIKRTAWYNQH